MPIAITPITITPKAAEKIKEFHAADPEKDQLTHLRLRISGGGCAGFKYDLYFDAPTDTDHQYVIEGVAVIMDPISEQYLNGTTLEYEDGLLGKGFKFNNPNVTAQCGCGEPFSA